MKFLNLSIPDVLLIEPTFLGDNRGYFAEIFRQDLLEKKLGYKVIRHSHQLFVKPIK